jgi:RNA polymerase sigma-70 factor (ECF subfamily)
MASFEESLALLPSLQSAASEIDLGALVETHSALLFRVAYSLLRSHAEAEDVVQDTFLRLIQKHRTLDDVRDHRLWLVRIAWNLSLDRLRRRRTRPADSAFVDSLIAPGTPADKALDESRRIHATLQEIEHLPRAERHALLLSSLEELENEEIAETLGRSESAVRGLLFRARNRLRERLEKAGYR